MVCSSWTPPYIGELVGKHGNVAALAGAEVYEASGAGDAISYSSAIASPDHCQPKEEWKVPPPQNIARFLLKTGQAPGAITAGSEATGNLAERKDWDRPSLD